VLRTDLLDGERAVGRTVLEIEGDDTANDEGNDLCDVAHTLEHSGLSGCRRSIYRGASAIRTSTHSRTPCPC
jgi:hypothetical protein